MHALTCQQCGGGFESKRRDARTCSAKCRVTLGKSSRDANRAAAAAVDTESIPVNVTASTLTELAAAGREGTALGQAALLLAYRIDRSQIETGPALAALVRQHNATLADALRGEGRRSSIDELRAKRDAKRAG